MKQTVDYAAFEFGLACPRLRDDLRFTLQQSKRHSAGGSQGRFEDRWYVIEDEANRKFYRVGHTEYTFLSLLDGNTTIQSAIAETASELGVDAFTENEAATMCRWLIETGLAVKPRHDLQHWAETRRNRKLVQKANWLNPIMLKVPLGNPESYVNIANRLVGWLVSWPIGMAMCVLWLVALATLMPHVESLFRPTAPILAATNWLWLGACWVFLRIVHETAHAVTCKRFGGSVREWGVLLLVFIPLPYVDVTSAWRFPSRWARVLTSAAGILAELSVAAVAAIVWCHSDSGLLRQNAANIMFSASITTLLFNANPLMRFDGYHILADVLNAPNLWTHGRSFIRGLGRRLFLELDTAEPNWRPNQKLFVKTYGFASVIWTVMIFVSLSLAALSLFDGIGLILSAIAVTLWLGVPVMRLGKFVLYGTEFEQPSRTRFALASLFTVSSIALSGYLLPAPSIVNAPIAVQHDPLTVVRAGSSGFVLQFDVSPGEHVDAGDVICRLQNLELESQLREVELQLATSQQRVRAFSSAGLPAAVQRESEATQDLIRKRDDLVDRIENLAVVAPISGMVLNDQLTDRVGSYVRRGSEIASIGGDGPKTAIALVSQSDASYLSALRDTNVEVRVWGSFGKAYSGHIRRVNPRAEATLPHIAFAACYGGPLPVVANDVRYQQDQDEKRGTPRTRWRLVDPRVHVEIELSEQASAKTQSGQTGVVLIRGRQERLGSYLVSGAIRYFREHIQKTHGI